MAYNFPDCCGNRPCFWFNFFAHLRFLGLCWIYTDTSSYADTGPAHTDTSSAYADTSPAHADTGPAYADKHTSACAPGDWEFRFLCKKRLMAASHRRRSHLAGMVYPSPVARTAALIAINLVFSPELLSLSVCLSPLA